MLKKIFLWTIFCLFSCSVFAATYNVDSLAEDLQKNVQLISTSPSVGTLFDIEHHLESLDKTLKLCIIDNKEALAKVEALFNDKSEPFYLKQNANIYDALLKEKEKIGYAWAYCNFLEYKLNNTLDFINDKIEQYKNKEFLLQKDDDILDSIQLILGGDIKLLNGGLDLVTWLSLLFQVVFALFALSFTYAYCYACATRIWERKIDRIKALFCQILIGSSFVYGVGIVMAIDQFNIEPQAYFFKLKVIMYLLIIIRVLISLLKNTKQWLSIKVTHKITHRMALSMLLILIGSLGKVVLGAKILPILGMLYAFILNILYVDWIKYVYTAKFKKVLLSKWSYRIFMLTIMAVILLGYQKIAMVFLPGMFGFYMLLIILWECSAHLQNIYHLFIDGKHSHKLKYYLGVKPNDRVREIFVLRLIVNVPLIMTFVLGLMEYFGKSYFDSELLINQFQDGVVLFGITFEPLNFLRACFIVALISLLGKLLASYINRNFLGDSDKHTHVTFYRLMNYSILATSIFIALYIIGINLSGVLIFASALSVGIGFGLQRFANDFISGLFLMFNRPIRIGDHIAFDNVEGSVKTIGMFSTQVRTYTHTDVMIPNSSLFSSVLTNFNFKSNKLFKCNIKVVIKDSNLPLLEIKEILLAIVKKHPNVITEGSIMPSVLFQGKNIEISFLVDDVNNRKVIISEIYMTIIEEFTKFKATVFML
jgi:small-conductance mechanosensitive channel